MEITVKKSIDVPAIPVGFAFSSAAVETRNGKRDHTFTGDGIRSCIQQAVAHVINHYGWINGKIYIHFSNDRSYGWHKLNCATGEWTTKIEPWEDEETVQLGTMPVVTEDDTPTRPVGLLEAEYVAEAMPVEYTS